MGSWQRNRSNDVRVRGCRRKQASGNSRPPWLIDWACGHRVRPCDGGHEDEDSHREEGKAEAQDTNALAAPQCCSGPFPLVLLSDVMECRVMDVEARGRERRQERVALNGPVS